MGPLQFWLVHSLLDVEFHEESFDSKIKQFWKNLDGVFFKILGYTFVYKMNDAYIEESDIYVFSKWDISNEKLR